MVSKKYKPIWPETIMFWGAGATASIGFKSTVQLGEFLLKLLESDDVLGFLKKDIYDLKIAKSLNNLCIILDSRKTIEKLEDIIIEEYGDFKDDNDKIKKYNRIKALRNIYDCNSLKLIINICPGVIENKLSLQDLFNIIDMHITSGNGFYTKGLNVEKHFLSLEDIIKAKSTLIMLITLIHSINYNDSLYNRQELLASYYDFGKCLSELMMEEGISLINKKFKTNSRKFYMCSYSVVSMNWDPILLWMIYNANRDYNNSASIPLIDTPKVPMKLFNDMGHFMAVRSIDSKDQEVWYPFNETVVQRINDPEHVTGKRVRIGKYYFPHGSSNWRECPNCGKLSMYLGNDWNKVSKSLFPPQLLPNLSFGFTPKSYEESKSVDNMENDLIQCPFCGTMIDLRHTPIVMQSNFKGNYPPYIESIQRDMRLSIEESRHIILMGYSLPPDDIIYRSMLSSRQNREYEPYCSVVVGKNDNAPDKWLYGDELQEYMKKEEANNGFSSAVKSAMDVFGRNRVRAYAKGIPAIFLSDGSVNKEKIRELLYPKNIFPKGIDR